MKLSDDIQDSIKLEEKGTKSDRVYNTIALICAVLSAVFVLIPLVAFLAAPNAGFRLWAILFYPMLIFVVLTLFFSIAELFRNKYFKSLLSLIIAIAVIVIAAVFIIIQATVYGNVYIVPFIYITGGQIPPAGTTPGLL